MITLDESPYLHSNTTCSDGDFSLSIVCRYPSHRHRTFLTGVFLVSVMFFWGMWFIDDSGWVLLGVSLVTICLFYYVLRVRRRITVDDKGVSRTTEIRSILWKWDDIDLLTVQSRNAEGLRDSPFTFRRVILSRSDNHEIVLDSNMENFNSAYRLLMDIAHRKNIEVNHENISFVIPFW